MRNTPSKRYIGKILEIKIYDIPNHRIKLGEHKGDPAIRGCYGFYNNRLVEVRGDGSDSRYPVNGLKPGDTIRVKITSVYADGAVLRGFLYKRN
ncbi:MAG: hypothetical protein QXJ06_01430 [Candidatus Aenigmatarchaeota archaeon]